LPNVNVSSAGATAILSTLSPSGAEADAYIADIGPLTGSLHFSTHAAAWVAMDPNYYSITVSAHVHSLGGSGTAHDHGLTQRPAAAIGTLQYMDL
jgi:hypothetical protein